MTNKKPIKKVEVLESSLEAIADHVAVIAEVGKMIKNSRLKERAILLLLKDATGLSMTDISRVLDALPKLEMKYLK